MNLRLLKRANLSIGATLIGVLLTVALIGMVHTPYNPIDVDLLARFAAPSALHWLGTDEFGRDVLSRMMAAAVLSMTVSTCSVLFAMVTGAVIGTLSGYIGGWVDRTVMMLIEALMAFPGLLLALGIMAVLGPSKWSVVLALGLAYSPSVTRLARASAMSLKQRDFVVASRAMGNSGTWTLFRHVLPNALTPLLVFSTSLFGSALLAESALSFLGLGVPAPAPTWGGMLADSLASIDHAVWLAIFPGAAISMMLLGINLFGDGLRDWLDPRMNGGGA